MRLSTEHAAPRIYNELRQLFSFCWRMQFSILKFSRSRLMNSIVYIVGAVVIVVAILGFLGLR